MSFILDALKKSEAERARQAGPALLEMRIVRPRRRVAPWIVALVLLLAVNLAVLLWFMLRREAPGAAGPPPAAPVAANAPLASAPVGGAPIGGAPVAGVPAASGPAADGRAALPAGGFAADPGARVAGEEPATDAGSDNPADFEPAANPGGGSVRVGPTARRNYSELAGEVPELRLDLHVYATRPQDRSALINMHRVREGDSLPEGPRVVEITRDGVVLEWQGREFMLGRE